VDENCFESNIWMVREDGDCNTRPESLNPPQQIEELMREAAPVFDFINAIGNCWPQTLQAIDQAPIIED
jgi:hypothetical protein